MPAPVGPPASDKLRAIQALTDSALSRLDDSDLLDELINRVRQVLMADTAAILLLDYPSGQLVAAAAAGLEEEVRQGVRIPVGRGFAGRIAAEHRPVILDRVDHTTVLNPILLDKGIQSLLGVPLVAGGRVLGVVHVGSLAGRVFTSHDAELLQLAADRAAVAVQSLVTRDDRQAAVALQRSLVPAALPTLPGIEMAGRYVPGTGSVGGDWYDVFRLPSGELGVAIGDVAGSGLSAAVVMGRMRSALRSYALQTNNPAEVLRLLDRKMQHFEPDVMATVLYVIMDQGMENARLSSAGHLPPIYAAPGQPAEVLAVSPDVLIGIDPEAERHVTTATLVPGALLCCYTDGLVERPGELIDAGIARLRKAVTAAPPEEVCAAVMRTMVGAEAGRDDIALLALRRPVLSTRPAT